MSIEEGVAWLIEAGFASNLGFQWGYDCDGLSQSWLWHWLGLSGCSYETLGEGSCSPRSSSFVDYFEGCSFACRTTERSLESSFTLVSRCGTATCSLEYGMGSLQDLTWTSWSSRWVNCLMVRHIFQKFDSLCRLGTELHQSLTECVSSFMRTTSEELPWD